LPWLGLAAGSLLAAACGMPQTATDRRATAESGSNRPVVGIAPVTSSVALANLTSGSAGLQQAAAQATATPRPSTPLPASTRPPASATPLTFAAAASSPAGATAQPSGTAALTASPAASATLTVTPAQTATAASSQTPPAVPPSSAAVDALAVQALALLNELRVKNGRKPLTFDATLGSIAASYARLMATSNSFGHNGPDGSSAFSRVGASGYGGRFEGETLAAGQASPQDVVSAWVNSPAHAGIIFSGEATEAGIGHYNAPSQYGHYWVLVAGSR
jgi:uncharacterized protein YkwD